jgi:hypothetical protein
MLTKKIVLTAAFGLLFVCGFAQEDYRKIFGRDYERALRYLDEEKWMNEIILSQGLNPKEVKAVVFPELIRFSALQDKFETFALESLYSQYGKAYANFSIGEFQIKPSFAEVIEKDFMNLFREKTFGIYPSDTVENIPNRAARVKRLKDKKAMLNYVLVFFKVMEKNYPAWKSADEKIKFFACAYNSDYRKTEKEIRAMINKKFFSASLTSSTNYSYSDIALFFYKHQSGN